MTRQLQPLFALVLAVGIAMGIALDQGYDVAALLPAAMA